MVGTDASVDVVTCVAFDTAASEGGILTCGKITLKLEQYFKV